jgi:hypothetical protein
VGPRTGQDARRNENSLSYRDSKSDPSVVQAVGSRYTDYTRQQSFIFCVKCSFLSDSYRLLATPQRSFICACQCLDSSVGSYVSYELVRICKEVARL